MLTNTAPLYLTIIPCFKTAHCNTFYLLTPNHPQAIELWVVELHLSDSTCSFETKPGWEPLDEPSQRDAQSKVSPPQRGSCSLSFAIITVSLSTNDDGSDKCKEFLVMEDVICHAYSSPIHDAAPMASFVLYQIHSNRTLRWMTQQQHLPIYKETVL
jgi:hypothetical protein